MEEKAKPKQFTHYGEKWDWRLYRRHSEELADRKPVQPPGAMVISGPRLPSGRFLILHLWA